MQDGRLARMIPTIDDRDAHKTGRRFEHHPFTNSDRVRHIMIVPSRAVLSSFISPTVNHLKDAVGYVT
jgi:hypothetical protein